MELLCPDFKNKYLSRNSCFTGLFIILTFLFPLRNFASLKTMEDPYLWQKLSLPELDFSLEGKIAGIVGNYVLVEGATVGFVGSCFAQYFIQKYTEINVFAYVFTGMAVCFVVGYLASFFFPEKTENMMNTEQA